MKHLLTVAFLLVGINMVSAQEKHFIFIQSDNNLPFFVQQNGKLFSSSATGYLIIPKLIAGQYNATIGFAQNAFPEQNFQYTIENKDLGYNLKNFGEKGWGLFNLQTYEVTMGTPSKTEDLAKAIQTQSTIATDGEPIITFDKKPKEPIEKPVSKPQAALTDNAVKLPLKIDGVYKIEIADKTTLKSSTMDTIMPLPKLPEWVENAAKMPIIVPQVLTINISDKTNIKTGQITALTEKPRTADAIPEIKKVSEVKNEEGLALSYIDEKTKPFDTIQLVIPTSPVEPEKVVIETSEVRKPVEENIIIDKEPAIPADTVQSNKPAFSNIICVDVASADDFYKLRKKMLGQMSDEKMISEAKKVFDSKCFTTAQLKALSVLFMSDEGRYRFLDASYNYATDPENFYFLQSVFIDPYYLKRFNAMLR